MSQELTLTLVLLAVSHLWWVYRAILRDLDRVNDEKDREVDRYPAWSIVVNSVVLIFLYAFLWLGVATILVWVFR